MRQPHDILGVPQNATQDQIKAAYRQLAKRYHPDFNRGDPAAEARFKEITGAYQQLTAKRPEPRGTEARSGAQAARHSARGTNGTGPNTGRTNGSRSSDGSAGFRQRDAKEAPRKEAPPKKDRPKDPPRRREAPRAASFEEELKRARDPRPENPARDGQSAGTEDEASAFSGFFSGLKRASRQAMGSDGQDEDYDLRVSFLEAALGTTKRLKLSSGKVLDVRIPAGLSDGQQIRLRGQGVAGRFGGPRGDALITVEVEPHDSFTREGLNISAPLPVQLADAVLGAKIRVPTIHGSVTVTVPPHSSSGRRLRLQGQGIRPASGAPSSGAKAGDHYAVVQIMLPGEADPALEKFIAGWAAERDGQPDEA